MAKSYKVKIMPSGYIYILFTIVLSVAAVNTGNNLLYLISSLMLALMLLSGLSSLMNLLFLEVSLSPSRAVFAGTPAPFRLTIRKRRMESFFLSCETLFGALRIPYVKGQVDKSLWLSFPKRGTARVDNLKVHSGFPLGFFKRFKICSLDLEVLVYPKPLPREVPALEGNLYGSAKTTTSPGELSDEVKELRAYRARDPFKWVDWKATARKGQIMVKGFYQLQGDTLVIDLSRKQRGWERRVSEACFLVLEGLKRDLLVSLLLPDKRIGPGRGKEHKKCLLEALSVT